MNKSYPIIFSLFLLFSCSSSDDSPLGDGDSMIMDDDNPGNIIENPQTGFLPCNNGMAGIYPCNGYDLLAQLGLAAFNASAGNDIWGWTDMTTGNEYALVGLDNGTAFVDITDTENLVYLGKLPTATVSSTWRDIKVYEDYAYIVSEAGGHGMQVFDLTNLRNVANAPVTFEADTRYTGFGNAHNIVINEASGYAYAVGTSTFNGGAHFINIQDPQNPIAAGGYGVGGYSHDAQVVTYNGPDTDYTGQEIFIGANENQVAIVNVTDKNTPQQISTFQYSNIGYTHQGWFSEDQRYFFLGDELDEIGNSGFNSRTLVFDLSDLDNPSLHNTYLGETAAIDHNGYVKGDEFYLANYTAGVRILDISGIEGQSIVEQGFFDTYPSNNTAAFEGVWSVYPYFESDKILVNDINSGLFVIKKSN